jgi:hypothetical protein
MHNVKGNRNASNPTRKTRRHTRYISHQHKHELVQPQHPPPFRLLASLCVFCSGNDWRGVVLFRLASDVPNNIVWSHVASDCPRRLIWNFTLCAHTHARSVWNLITSVSQMTNGKVQSAEYIVCANTTSKLIAWV